MVEKKKEGMEKIRKEFFAGFAAGAVCFGIAAVALLIIFSL